MGGGSIRKRSHGPRFDTAVCCTLQACVGTEGSGHSLGKAARTLLPTPIPGQLNVLLSFAFPLLSASRTPDFQRQPGHRSVGEARVRASHDIRRLRSDIVRLCVPELVVPGVPEPVQGGSRPMGPGVQVVGVDRARDGNDPRARWVLELRGPDEGEHSQQLFDGSRGRERCQVVLGADDGERVCASFFLSFFFLAVLYYDSLD